MRIHFGRTVNLLLALVLAASAVRALYADVVSGLANQLSISTSNGAPDGSSGTPAVPINGGIVVFNSNASNLVSDDTNKFADIFARDLTTGAITRINVSSSNQQSRGRISNGQSISPITPNGFYAIAYSSDATNLGTVDDSASFPDIFLRVPSIGLTDVVTVTAAGALGNDDSSSPSITTVPNPNRALIVFASDASNFVNGDSAGKRDIFLATVDIPATAAESIPAQQTTIERITVGASGAEADGDSDLPKISGDGVSVVFTSQATNLVEGITTSGQQIFRYSLATGKISLVSKNSSGAQANASCTTPSVSYSGRYVAYSTAADNILAGGVAGKSAIFMHDLVKGTITRANSDSSGNASTGNGRTPAISGNGRFVSFSDSGDNLVQGDANGLTDVFVKDLDNGSIARVSVGVNGEADAASDSNAVASTSYNALQGSIFYRSFATNLTSASTASGAGDIFTTSATFSAPQLKKGTRIETPPDITVSGKKSVIVLQKFSFPSSAAVVVERSGVAPRAVKRAVNYEVRLKGTGMRKNVRATVIAKRNMVTIGKLKPGVYSTRYRVTATQNGKVVSRTPFSPRQTFTIS